MLMSEYFDQTAAILEKGWCQGSAARDANGSITMMGDSERPPAAYCMDGALYAVHLTLPKDKTNSRWEVYKQAGAFLDVMFGELPPVVNKVGKSVPQKMVSFNDMPDQTQDNIVAFVKKAADVARLKEKAEADVAAAEAKVAEATLNAAPPEAPTA